MPLFRRTMTGLPSPASIRAISPANSAAVPQAQNEPGRLGFTLSMPSRMALAAPISESPCVSMKIFV